MLASLNSVTLKREKTLPCPRRALQRRDKLTSVLFLPSPLFIQSRFLFPVVISPGCLFVEQLCIPHLEWCYDGELNL